MWGRNGQEPFVSSVCVTVFNDVLLVSGSHYVVSLDLHSLFSHLVNGFQD